MSRLLAAEQRLAWARAAMCDDLRAVVPLQVGIVRVPDDSVTGLQPGDVVVYDRWAHDVHQPPEPGDLVVLDGEAGRTVRRVVGVPGEQVTVRLGVVRVAGSLRSLPSAARGSRLDIPETVVGLAELLVLPLLSACSDEIAVGRNARVLWLGLSVLHLAGVGLLVRALLRDRPHARHDALLAVGSLALTLTESNPGANIESGARRAPKRCSYRVFRSRSPGRVGRRAALSDPANFDCTEWGTTMR